MGGSPNLALHSLFMVLLSLCALLAAAAFASLIVNGALKRNCGFKGM